MYKYFFCGMLCCFLFLVSFSLILVKYVSPILEKNHHKKSCLKVYQMCQELIKS